MSKAELKGTFREMLARGVTNPQRYERFIGKHPSDTIEKRGTVLFEIESTRDASIDHPMHYIFLLDVSTISTRNEKEDN